jgi:hypothetical protein
MNKETGLRKLETFLLWLLIIEFSYILIFSIISFIAWPSDAIWDIFHDMIRAGVLIPLFFAFLFNVGGALFGLVCYAFNREGLREQLMKPGILFNWIFVAVFSIPYLILFLQISFFVLNQVKFFETYF